MTRLLLVVVCALAARLAYVALVYDGPETLMQPDSAGYLELADGIAERGAFGRVDDAGFHPETYRMPGYPAWLAPFRLADDGPLAPVICQAALDALTCLLIALLASRLEPRLGLAAGLAAAVNPTMITSAAYVLTDSLFLFLFTGWMLATVAHMTRPTARSAMLAGLMLGLATLVRAVTQFVPPLLALVVVVAALRAGTRPAWALGHGMLALVACLAVLTPVAIHNHARYGHLALTSQGGRHALLWVAPAALEYAEGVPFAEGRRRLADRLSAYPENENPFAASARAQAVARDELRGIGWAGLARAWLAGAAINLGAPSVTAVPAFQRLERPRFYATPGDGPVQKALNVLGGAGAGVAMLLVGGVAATAAVRAVQLIGVARLGRRLLSLPWLFLFAVAVYVLLVTGPVTGVKYRLPLEPLLTMLFALGLLGRRQRPAHGEPAACPATTPPTGRS